MKVLMVSALDTKGGAAIATYRLHKALLKEGIQSIMLVRTKYSYDNTVIELSNFSDNRISWKYVKKELTNRFWIVMMEIYGISEKTKFLFNPSVIGNPNFMTAIESIKPDIVHLNWIASGLGSIDDICKIKYPVVWTLHDMWAFTGGCHITWGCTQYTSGCGKCPAIQSNSKNDISKLVFNKKKKTYAQKKDIFIVCPSRWLLQSSQQSPLLKDKKHFLIPYMMDTSTFKPLDKKWARQLWNLPQNKKIILMGAASPIRDPNKGFRFLKKALTKEQLQNSELVIFGERQLNNSIDIPVKYYNVGFIQDTASLVSLYNAADVVVVPSIQENLCNVILESLSCGVPVVAFDIGGNSDMIEHTKNGYLARPYDVDDLAHGIAWVLNSPNYDQLTKNAREKVLREFIPGIVTKKYIQLYEKILDGSIWRE